MKLRRHDISYYTTVKRILSAWHKHGDIIAIQENLIKLCDLPTFRSSLTAYRVVELYIYPCQFSKPQTTCNMHS